MAVRDAAAAAAASAPLRIIVGRSKGVFWLFFFCFRLRATSFIRCSGLLRDRDALLHTRNAAFPVRGRASFLITPPIAVAAAAAAVNECPAREGPDPA